MAIERDKEKFHHIVEIDAFTGRNIYRHETLFSEEEYFEDITHPNLNSIHVTMTDFDSNDMQLKHRCVEHHAASDDGHRIGHVNNAYFTSAAWRSRRMWLRGVATTCLSHGCVRLNTKRI